ncbi:MAG: tetratricopeptide repeat protein [Planctomycetes bacterium]|nr:tetratricopeptide repeat protein [Planctomycetota bacterium]
MGPHFERGRLLLEQERHDLAIREFELELAEDPDQAHVHALLALCHRGKEDHARAAEHARRAIELAPDAAFVHYVHAQVALGAERFAEALKSLDEAIRLDADDADSHALRAAVLLRQEKRKEALAAAEQALALDAEHALAQNVRASALVTLGRAAEARVGLNEALERRPEDAFTHANQGWTLLHAGDHRRAIEHFGEALRLDPTDAWTKEGLLTALKARYLVYRWIFAFHAFASRLSPGARWGIVLGAIFGLRVLRASAKGHPPWDSIVLGVGIAYSLFVFLTWTSDALFDLAMFAHPQGRRLLAPVQRITSAVVGAVLAIAIVLAGVGLALGPADLVFCAAGWIACVLTVSIAGTRRVGAPRVGMAVFAGVVVAGVAIGTVLSLLLDGPEPATWTMLGSLLAAVASTWIANVVPRQHEAEER